MIWYGFLIVFGFGFLSGAMTVLMILRPGRTTPRDKE